MKELVGQIKRKSILLYSIYCKLTLFIHKCNWSSTSPGR